MPLDSCKPMTDKEFDDRQIFYRKKFLLCTACDAMTAKTDAKIGMTCTKNGCLGSFREIRRMVPMPNNYDWDEAVRLGRNHAKHYPKHGKSYAVN